MDAKRVQSLVEKYIEGIAMSREVAQLHDLYRDANNRQIQWPEEKDAVRLRMLAEINRQTAPIRRLWPRIAAAVAILAFLQSKAL